MSLRQSETPDAGDIEGIKDQVDAGSTSTLPPTGDKAGQAKRTRLDWPGLLAVAAPLIDAEYAKVGVAPTLRRVHYLLVSDATARAMGYVNTENCYKSLSRHTTAARDAGTFPQLADQTRSIEYASGYHSPATVLSSLAYGYRLNREQYLDARVILIAEKSGIVPLLTSRYGWLTVTASRGYASVSHARDIAALADPERPTVALYIGDYDPTGLDIDRALAARLPFPLVRIALNADQVRRHELPPMPVKATDSRGAAMLRDQGQAVQVELDALPTDALFALVDASLSEYAGVRLRADGKPDLPDADDLEATQRQWLRDVSRQAPEVAE
jgi:hypothetical protein